MSRIAQLYPAHALRAAGAVAATLPVLLVVSMGYARRWVSEDAFIDLRVARHLLAGHGPVFNVGERVEAYTNPLWVALLTAWGALGGSLEGGAVAMGLGLSIAGMILAQAGAWRLACRAQADGLGAGRAGDLHLALPLGAAIFASLPVAWDFTTSGLESGLTTAWLGGVFWLLARSRPVRAARLAAFTIGCGPLIRPDLALFSIGFGAALVTITRHASDGRPARGEWIRLAASATALPLCYQVFRMGYFAALVPNTALAKEASAAYWAQGWRYTVDFVGAYALWLPLAVVAVATAALWRSARRADARADAALVLAVVLSAGAHWLYVTRVGGDFMHGRLLLPTLLALLLPVATVTVRVRALLGWRGAMLAGVAIWAVVCAVWLRAPYTGQAMPGPWGIADERGFYTHHTKVANPVFLSDYLQHSYVAKVQADLRGRDRMIALSGGPEGLAVAASLAPDVPQSVRAVIGLTNIGILGYLAGSDVWVIDRLGLSDPIAGRLVLAHRSRPGHEKMLPEAWILGRFGDPAAAGSIPGSAEAAAALRCGELARLLRAVEAPLTPSRFLANMRDAWALHRLRVPADPAAARQRFCPAPGLGR